MFASQILYQVVGPQMQTQKIFTTPPLKHPVSEMTPTIDQSLNILVVDDEVNIRKTLSVCLEAGGYKVIAVSNFQEL
jgi:PleD family two-component response regulator